MNQLLGPILILAGMFVVGLFRPPAFGLTIGQRISEHLAGTRFTGAFLLGVLFALAFCPISAAIFFGSLLPQAAALRSSVAVPAFYGLGTAIPVLVFAMIIAVGTKSMNAVFQRISAIELWGRRLTGTVLILVGIYLSWTNLIA